MYACPGSPDACAHNSSVAPLSTQAIVGQQPSYLYKAPVATEKLLVLETVRSLALQWRENGRQQGSHPALIGCVRRLQHVRDWEYGQYLKGGRGRRLSRQEMRRPGSTPTQIESERITLIRLGHYRAPDEAVHQSQAAIPSLRPCYEDDFGTGGRRPKPAYPTKIHASK